MHRYFDEVHTFIRTNDLFDRGESILVGFSGGPDSMFLAEALIQISSTYKYGWQIHLAHLNHGITEASGDNEKFCRQMSRERLNVPLSYRYVDIPALHASGKYKGMSVEQLGRRERYKLFIDVCREKKISKLATGHQLDDQAETVIMRAIGGSWLTGLSGIPVRRTLSRDMNVEVVRPLLRVTRKQIDDWIKSEDVPFFNDQSNFDQKYHRNKVRHQLIPMLIKEFNPQAKRHLAALGQQAQELETELKEMAESFLEEPETRSGQVVMRVPLEKLINQGPLGQRYVLRAALNKAGMRIREVTHRRVERIRDLIESHRRGVVVKLSDGASVMLDDDNVVITVTHTESEPESVTSTEFEITRDGRWVADVDKGTVSRVTAEMLTMPEGGVNDLLSGKPAEIEYLDAESVLFPLFMRGRKDGDRMQPLGLDGEKKIHDIFIDNKLPRDERDLVPLVCDSSGIVIVSGQCIAHRNRIKPTSRQILKVTLVPRSLGSGSNGWLPPVT